MTTVRTALDELAEAAADDGCPVTALATVVLALERAAGAPLGRTDLEPRVVLQRRFGRAHRRLRAGAVSYRDVLDLLAALRPAGALPPQRVAAPPVLPDPVPVPVSVSVRS
jgi:hypothetical protein